MKVKRFIDPSEEEIQAWLDENKDKLVVFVQHIPAGEYVEQCWIYCMERPTTPNLVTPKGGGMTYIPKIKPSFKGIA